MELRQYKQWLWFKKIRRVDLKGKEKILKLPMSPITLKSSDWNNMENWADFETAVNNIDGSGSDGLSFVLSMDDPFLCIDLDNVSCDMRERFFRDFHDTYIEISQSGKGLHIFAKGEIADNFNMLIALVVDLTLWRVEILAHLLGGVQDASTEAGHLTADGMNGENHSPPEAIGYHAVFVEAREAGLFEVFPLEPLGHGGAVECIARLQTVAQLEFADRLFAKSALREVGEADRATLFVLHEAAGEVFLRPGVEDKHAFAVALGAQLVVRKFAFANFDVILLGQVAKGVGIAQLLVLHDEVDGRSALATGEALAEVLGGRDVERGVLVGMEGAKADEIDAAFPQRDKLGDDIDNLRRLEDAVFRCGINHRGRRVRPVIGG